MDASLPSPETEPLLLLPGLICDARIFAGQRAAFPTATVPDYGDAADLGAIADHILGSAPPRFAVLGHSMGARIALEIVRRVPARVTRLALVSTGVHLPSDGEAAARHALRDIGRAEGMAALVDAWLPPMVAASRRSDPAFMAPLHAMCISAGLARFESQVTALLARPEVESLLPAIRVPVLIAVGSDDAWSSPDQHEAIAAQMPNAALVVVAGAGHMLPVEAPAELNAAISSWLTKPQGDHR